MKTSMKNLVLFGLAALCVIAVSTAAVSTSSSEPTATPEYKIITVVESIIPMGIGRSRMIENKTEVNTADATTERTNGKKSDQGQIKRKDRRVDEFAETKLLNFYSAVGINFQNIASNDALIAARISELSAEGWTLDHVLSGVESDAGETDRQGIYITRLIFKK